MNIGISLSEEEADAIRFGAWMAHMAMSDCLEKCDENCSGYEDLLDTYGEVGEILNRIYYVYENTEAMKNAQRTNEPEAVHSDYEKFLKNTAEIPSKRFKRWKIRIKEGIPYVLESMVTIVLWEIAKLLFG